MNHQQLVSDINHTWDTEIIPQLIEFIRIPNKSPHFDADWEAHGFMDQAVNLVAEWCKVQPIAGLSLEVIRLPSRTPLIYMEIPGQLDETVLLYGHLDKQPEMSGWDDDLGPWHPVLRDNKLYGRGGADDGYAAFASLTAIASLQKQGIPHARCVILIEACEESGSYDLPHYLTSLASKIGQPNLVICLDSGCANYNQLWSTTSLRGVIAGELRIEVNSAGVHSGAYSGILPDPSRIFRQLLDRIEDSSTGEILIPECHAKIPEQRLQQAQLAADILSPKRIEDYPLLDGVEPVTRDVKELILNSTWRPTLCVIGADGLPSINNAGNVLRPKLAVKLSFRIPPTVNPDIASEAIKKTLETDPPYCAKVHYIPDQTSCGWHAPLLAPWLEKASADASNLFFGKPAAYLGEGGSIPFMGMLGDMFPQAQFLITGVLGPKSNAHGPNEFLHIPMGKNLTACVAYVIAKHFAEFSK
ncbi:MAG: M20 family metallopeptidase [Legionellales bacterium]|nr:M20 family metallopeptidase [Legionellales bacterium]